MEFSTTVWVIALTRDSSGIVEPHFYYNPEKDIFQRESTNECYYVSENIAQEELEKLNTSGTMVLSGRLKMQAD